MVSNRPTSHNMDSWMRDVERRQNSVERRASIRSASQILGPGFGPKASAVTDWNSSMVVFNGYYYSEIGSLNSPSSSLPWVCHSVVDPQGNGWQHIISRDSTGLNYRRFIHTPLGGATIFGAWVSTDVDDSGWQIAPYSSGWGDASGSLELVRYRKVDDEVTVRGACTRSSGGGFVPLTLPAGVRPTRDIDRAIFINGAWGAVKIDTIGVITLIGAATPYADGQVVSFDFGFSVIEP